MGLDSIVRSGIATAKSLTASLQNTITIKPWIGTQDAFGKPRYGSPVEISAVVDPKQKERRTSSGKIVMTTCYIVILESLESNGAAGRVEPVDPRDVVTLPDGTTSPIVDVAGFMDPTIARPFYSEIWLG